MVSEDLKFSYLSNENESYFTFSVKDMDKLAWIGIDSSGIVSQFVGQTDGYNWRGYQFHCDDTNCYSGCVAPEPSKCWSGDNEFIQARGIMSKWNYTSNYSLGLSNCEEMCKRSCSCTAYAAAQSNGTGCRFSDAHEFYRADLQQSADVFYFARQGSNKTKLWYTIGSPVVFLSICIIVFLNV
ncbi:hypothetical protein Acr_08g0002390 [Actinidia rufa]|uniref:Apple domain-containing protein n=1 Tax=Actinidia rufa TaxID=165716 RepID=A0A7J0EZP1_9ERIC|nr:hypothetical protein Acr_08g0002390 [Actinidia rufa]